MKKLIILLATCSITLLHGAAGGEKPAPVASSISSLRKLALQASGQALTHALPLSLIPQEASSSSALPESATLPFDIRSITSSSSLSLQRITREDIATYINSLKIGDTPTANTPLAHELINATASAIAHDEYLRLRSQDKLNARNAYDKLSPFLQEHFAGVSIQDLINNNLLLYRIYRNQLDLSDLHISSLKGLESIPNINNLTKLNMNGNLLTALEPGVFTELSNLEELFLGFNKLTNLEPGVFIKLTNLEELSLRSNQLTTLEPGTFSELTKLQRLSLSSNQLTALEPGAFTELSNIKVLSLDNNQLTDLEQGTFAGLTKLQMLSLSNNQLTALKPGTFTQLTNLTDLYLYNNRLTTLEIGVFAGLTKLRQLLLNNNQFTQEEQARIKTELQTVTPNAKIEF